ncbi:MAG: hypothetical protein IJC43_02510 [Clostridia bacterium]|nr:hypothetical protein [Clostridia bacterium]
MSLRKARPLFGSDVSPRCSLCEHGRVLEGNPHISCRYRGMVTEGYHCRRFRYDPLKRVPPKAAVLPKFEAEDFSID